MYEIRAFVHDLVRGMRQIYITGYYIDKGDYYG